MTDLKLYESEYRFMDLIWEAEPVRSTELAKMAREAGVEKIHLLYGFKEAGGQGLCKERGCHGHVLDWPGAGTEGREQPADRKELRRFSSGLSQCVPQRTQADG